jgi:hypothetical protein
MIGDVIPCLQSQANMSSTVRGLAGNDHSVCLCPAASRERPHALVSAAGVTRADRSSDEGPGLDGGVP